MQQEPDFFHNLNEEIRDGKRWLERTVVLAYAAAAGLSVVAFTLLADGRAVHSRPVADNRPFRLPGGYLAEKVAVELTGTATVKGVWLGESMADLAG